MSSSDKQKKPRELLQSVLESELSDGACDQLHLPHKTTYLTALILGAVERALRGDNQAWSAVMNFTDPPVIFEDDGYTDEMSAALAEFFGEIAAKM